MDAEFPLVDRALADEFFAETDPKQAAELRALVDELVADVGPRLARVNAWVPEAAADPLAVRELHQLCGNVGNFGLQRAGQRLRRLEREWRGLSVDQRRVVLTQVEEEFRIGLAQLRALYPILAR